jgi:predicted dehydrogenase
MNEKKAFGLAIVGCGYVADFYMATLKNYPALYLVGVYDKDPARLKVFCEYYSLTSYASMKDLLKDENVDIILNLTNPRSHYDVSRQCLDANKHVYSEKPLAMTYEKAKDLVEYAKAKDLKISSAPCSVLSKAAKTLAHAVREKMAGKIKLVYAELDDGLVHKMPYKKWISESGAPWNMPGIF